MAHQSPLTSSDLNRAPTTYYTKSPVIGRQYTGLDRKNPVAEYTTFHTTPNTSSFHDTTTSSGGLTSGSSADIGGGTTGGGQGSVINAFRDLQNKVKVIEQERYDAIRERDSLRAMAIERKRHYHLETSKVEMGTTESLIALQSTHEKLKREYDEVNQRVRAQEDIHESIQRKLRSQQHLHHTLQDDVDRSTQRRLALEKNLVLLKQDAFGLKERCDQVETTVTITSPSKHATQTSFLQCQIQEVESSIMKAAAKNHKLTNKIQSIETYIDLIIKINGELCDTLVAREEAKARLTRISRSLSPPPRYQWPKEVPYSSVMQVINEAAKATAQAAVESTTLHATEMAMKNVIRALTPPRHQNRIEVEDSESSSVDEVDDVRKYSSKSPLSANSPFGSRLSAGMASLSLHGSGTKSQGSAGKHISFDDKLQLSEYEDDTVSTSSGESATSDEVLQQKKKSKKKRSARRRSSISSSSSVPATLSTTSNRKRTLQNVIARQGAITSATRLAAAAVAASTALKVVNPASTSLTNSTISSQSKSRSKDDGMSKADFIPASGSRSSEFNVVASVSKASRAAKTLNATIASK